MRMSTKDNTWITKKQRKRLTQQVKTWVVCFRLFQKGIGFMKNIKSLNRNQDFKRVYLKGRYAASQSLVTYALKNRFKSIRMGITTSKKIGNAVQRNRCRRIIRAAYLHIQSQLPDGFDIVFVARSNTPNVKSYDISREMSYQLRKIGLLK